MSITPEDIRHLATITLLEAKEVTRPMDAGLMAAQNLIHGIPWPPTEAVMAILGSPDPGTRAGRFWRFGFDAAVKQRWPNGVPTIFHLDGRITLWVTNAP